MRKWIVAAISVAGLVALCALIWFVSPLIGFGESRPFESVWLRLAVIVLILAVFFGVATYRLYRRRAAAQLISAAISAPAPGEPNSDEPVLAERMADAIATLKQSRSSRGDFLYELPWYIIIGPPGSGKTTALLNSGLKFPLMRGGAKGAVAGVGGTRYCDWWFTEDAVLIDTAGRYTTQDSDTEADRKSWLAFLDLLKTQRPRQPINGVLVAISLEDLMRLSQAEIAAHAVAIRKRLSELNGRLGINFPVYAVFTKADLVSGFMEYFGNFNDQRRKVVWGATFQSASKTENRIADVEPEFDLLVQRLTEELPDRLQEEADPLSRTRLYGFPSQMAALKSVISDFLAQIFEPTRYHTSFVLRGFYFTSGTQEGTPIDKVLGSISGAFGLQGTIAPAYSGRAKSFFLADLLSKVIFGEAGWVSTNRAAVRRMQFLTFGGYALAGLVTAALLAAWWISYGANSALIAQSEQAVADYQQAAAVSPVPKEPVKDSSVDATLEFLDRLRNLPSGYASAGDSVPVSQTFGLSQKGRLIEDSQDAYRIALDRMFRSRLLLFVEKQIENSRDDINILYPALKVYLMLGGQGNVRIDSDLVEAWFAAAWDIEYPGPAAEKLRARLVSHLKAMLELGTNPPEINLNGPLVETTQQLLASSSLADRAYALLEADAAKSDAMDWTAGTAGGPHLTEVFETKNLDKARVPYFYTYDGFYDAFMTRLGDVDEVLEDEKWVLGKAGENKVALDRYQKYGPELLDMYDRKFIASWDGALAHLKLRNFASDGPVYAVLAAASQKASPIRKLIESISRETSLTVKPPEPTDDAGAITGVAAAEAKKLLTSRTTGLGRIGLGIAFKSQARNGKEAAPADFGSNIESYFQGYHDYIEVQDGRSAIDDLLTNLHGIYQYITDAEGGAADPQGARDRVRDYVRALRRNATTLPEPFGKMLKKSAEDFEGKVTTGTIDDLQGRLNSEVTQRCLQLTKNRFPFAPRSKADVGMADFGKLFAPGGILDQFYKENLEPLIDNADGKLVWKADTRIGRTLNPDTLKQFQDAMRIRDAFFATGGNFPNANLSIVLKPANSDAATIQFEVNGQTFDRVTRVAEPINLQWPGAAAGGSASVTINRMFQSDSVLRATGPWALFRLFTPPFAKNASWSGQVLSASLVVDGQLFSFDVTAASSENPIGLPALRGFKCPSDL